MPRILFHIHHAKQRSSRAVTYFDSRAGPPSSGHQSTVGNAAVSIYIAPENPSQSAVAERREKRGRMKSRILLLSVLSLALAFAAAADTLRLTTGQVIYGQFVTRTPEGIQFTGPDGVTNAYPPGLVASLTFGPVPTPPPAPPQVPQMITVPTGTLILVQTTDELDTSYTQTGQVFSAPLVTNLANGDVVARSGTPVYGQVVAANSAGRATGRSKMELQLTQIVINGDPYPIVTTTYSTEGKSSGRRSAFRLFGGAGLGAAIGAIAGNAGMGAAIGAVAGGVGAVVQKGNQVQIPAETQLQFTLQQPLTLPALPNSY
jgi:hypothetical protein